MTDRNANRSCAGEPSPEMQAALAELLALLDELAQRCRRLRAEAYVPRRDRSPE